MKKFSKKKKILNGGRPFYMSSVMSRSVKLKKDTGFRFTLKHIFFFALANKKLGFCQSFELSPRVSSHQ